MKSQCETLIICLICSIFKSEAVKRLEGSFINSMVSRSSSNTLSGWDVNTINHTASNAFFTGITDCI